MIKRERYQSIRLHKLVTEELKDRFRELGEQDTDNPIVVTRYHSRHTNWAWYPISYNPCVRIFYGYVHGDGDALKQFTLEELESTLLGKYKVLQRDTLWKEITLSELKEKIKKGML